ncbi:hypothetical protein [Streptomyces sp. NPDC001833]|uniref:hypothetical protein n=1 Tax=Streptomyces sp. NPDC001833 TaxID=3154658 RepID=UPI00332438F1
MAARDIAYVELYAKDKQRAAQHLVSGLGFACVADSVAPDRSSLLLREGSAHLVVTSGPATWKFLDAHGEGIADIALVCTDVTATVERALRTGARRAGSVRGNPILSGAGGLTHTLLPAARTPRGWPAGHRWVELPPRTGRPAGRVRRLDGVTIGVGGARAADCARLYRDGFGLVPRRSELELAGSQGELKLTLKTDNVGAIHQLSFVVDDMVHTAHELRSNGAEFEVPDPPEGAGPLRLVGRSPHLGDTLRLELVEAVDQPRLAAG